MLLQFHAVAATAAPAAGSVVLLLQRPRAETGASALQQLSLSFLHPDQQTEWCYTAVAKNGHPSCLMHTVVVAAAAAALPVSFHPDPHSGGHVANPEASRAAAAELKKLG